MINLQILPMANRRSTKPWGGAELSSAHALDPLVGTLTLYCHQSIAFVWDAGMSAPWVILHGRTLDCELFSVLWLIKRWNCLLSPR